MTEDVNPQLGMSRRQLLRRGAIVGGTLVWAAPTVQAIAPRAFAQDGTPLSGFSYFAATVSCADDGEVYRVKANLLDDGTLVWECDPGDGLPTCNSPTGGVNYDIEPPGWGSAKKAFGGTVAQRPATCTKRALNIQAFQQGLDVHLCLPSTDPCTFEFNGGVNGVIKEALRCEEGQVYDDGRCIRFTGPF